MQRKYLLNLILALVPLNILTCCRLAGGQDEMRPFKGYWHAVVPADSVNDGYQLFVRFDFYDSTVCVDGYSDALGVMSITDDRAVYRTITNDVVKDVRIEGDTLAHIKYVQESSGQLWSGTVRFNTKTHELTFTNGEMLAPGPDRNAEPADIPYVVNPTEFSFDFVSPKPNYKEIPSYYLVMELPDRVYYRNVISDETVAPPFGDLQLRCYYPAADRDVNITDEVGLSPLGSNNSATIVDCWKLPDAPGLMLMVWKGGAREQALTMYRVDDDEVFEEIYFVTGLRSVPRGGVEAVDSSKVASFYRSGQEVRAYNPLNGERRVYDLSGRRIR